MTHRLSVISLYRQFPARAPKKDTPEFGDIQRHLADMQPGLGRTAFEQAGYQMAALGATLAVAIVGGLLTGTT